MNCIDIQRRLLAGDKAGDTARHLAACPACRSFQRLAARAVTTPPAAVPPPALDAAVGRAARELLAQRHAARARRFSLLSAPAWRWAGGLAAAVAALLVAWMVFRAGPAPAPESGDALAEGRAPAAATGWVDGSLEENLVYLEAALGYMGATVHGSAAGGQSSPVDEALLDSEVQLQMQEMLSAEPGPLS